jgi:hypothetical protein
LCNHRDRETQEIHEPTYHHLGGPRASVRKFQLTHLSLIAHHIASAIFRARSANSREETSAYPLIMSTSNVTI